jgi:hypothetical protein
VSISFELKPQIARIIIYSDVYIKEKYRLKNYLKKTIKVKKQLFRHYDETTYSGVDSSMNTVGLKYLSL